jgi:hypothetical protein
MKNKRSIAVKIFGFMALFAAIVGVSSCYVTPATSPYDTDLVALTDNNMLLKLNASDPSVITKQFTIKGLAADEKILAIDFRPATGQLYGVSTLFSPIQARRASLARRLLHPQLAARSSA